MSEKTDIKSPEQLAAAVRREDGKVWIDGVPEGKVGWAWDMLLRGAEIVLKHRGERVSLDGLMAYSGDAFHLCHGSHWQGMAYMMIPTDTMANVAQAYGYEGEWVYSRRTKDLPARRRDTDVVLERIRAEIDAGRPVMVGGSADQGCGPWSVVVGYDRDRRRLCHIGIGQAYRWTGIRGIEYELNPEDGKTGFWNGRLRGKIGGRTGGWLDNLAFFLGRKTPAPDERQRILATLRRAVDLSGASSFFMGGAGGITFCYGQQAYEQWALDLHELDYPGDLKKSQPKDAYDWYEMGNMDTQVDQVVRGRSAAADFCDAAAKVLPKGAGDLRAAAKAYREEVAIARGAFAPFIPAYDGNDKPRVAWLSSEAKREAGVAAIRQMLAKERAAVAAVEKALAAEGVAVPVAAPPPGAVKVEPGQEVLIKEAVEAFDDLIGKTGAGHVVAAGKDVYQQPPVYLTMHVIEMRAAGWTDADYDTLAAVSGASALFGYMPTDFGPKYAHLLIGPDERIAEATGFGYEWLNFADADQAWGIIKASLDAGKCVKGMHYENCAFVGYRDAAAAQDRQLYVVGDGPGTFSKWWTWKEFTKWEGMIRGWKQARLGRHTKRVAKADAKAVALRVMNDLVAWSKAPPPACRKRWPKALWGIAGIETYAADVADLSKKPKEHFKDTAWCACHGINGQWTARNASAVYLESVAGSGAFPKEVNDHLLAAAEQYRAAFTAWQIFYEKLGHKAPKDAWLDKARREAGAKAAHKWVECEKAAVAAVEQALAAEGVKVDVPAPAAATGPLGNSSL